jgi:hypothetical protein
MQAGGVVKHRDCPRSLHSHFIDGARGVSPTRQSPFTPKEVLLVAESTPGT